MARDLQMKYDIAKDEGPLRKTINTASKTGLDERVRNLETHLAVRYGESLCLVTLIRL
jgi:hypothetical protein